jgi:hypothetical protein
MLFITNYTNSLFPFQQDFLKPDLEKKDLSQDEIVDEPYELEKPTLSEYEIREIADKISSKLVKLVEEQLMAYQIKEK